MTESDQFKTTLGVLGATLLAPLFVASGNLGGGPGTVQEKLKNYVAAAAQSVVVKDDVKKDDTKADGTEKNEGKAAENNQSDADNQNKTPASSTPPASTRATDNASAKKAGTYTVKAGDTYGCIAEKYYGSYEQWPRVYAANAGWPGYEEYTLNVGAKLQMPAVEVRDVLPKTTLCQ